MLSIIIPTYNERESICPLIEDILNKTPKNILQEILIIDDNSKDGTAALVKNKQYPLVKIIQREEKGLASAINTGIKQVQGTHVLWFDADLYMIPDYIKIMHEKCQQGYDAVIASRYVLYGSDQRKALRKYTSLLLNKLAKILLKTPFTDFTSGIIMCDARKLQDIKFHSGYAYGEYFIDLLISMDKERWLVCEIGYVIKDRLYGKSKATLNFLYFINVGFKYIIRIITLAWKSQK